MAAFFFLYMTEGIPLGFTATAIATQMRRQGLTPSQIGIFVGTLYLPWAWKWVMGPIVDVLYSNKLGRRRGWILAMQTLMAIGLAAIMPINFTTELTLFTAMVMVINAFGATQDVAIDALAVGVLSDSERGTANGLMFAGAYVGQAIGGSGVLLLTPLVGFNSSFFLIAASILAVTVFIVLPMKEQRPSQPPVTPDDRYAQPGDGLEYARAVSPDDAPAGAATPGILTTLRTYAVDAIKSIFGSGPAIAGLVFAVLPAGAMGLSLSLGSNLAVELGMSDATIGVISLISTIISALACVVGGFLSDRLGRKKMLALYILGITASTVAYALMLRAYGWIMPRDPKAIDPATIPQALVAGYIWIGFAFGLFMGLMYGTRTALFMDVCNPAVAATQFTAYMAILNLVIWYSSTWQGLALEKWGYPNTLLADSLLGVVGLAMLPFMKRRARETTPTAQDDREDQSALAADGHP